MKDLVSIVIPAYNIRDCLGTTLDSILAQTYENIEIIIVDDGSEDGTGAVADAYAAKDGRIRVIHKENGGVTSARLRGVTEAKGAYIGFVDGDDFAEPQMYERLMENMHSHGADISHCGYRMVFPSRVDYYYNTGKLVLQEGKQGCLDLLDARFVEPGLVNKLYARGLFDGLIEWMDASIRNNEDLLMNFYLFRNAEKAVFEDVCPYHYVLRKNSASTSRLNEHKLRDPLSVLHILLDETAEDPACNAIIQRRTIYQLVSMSTLPLGDQKELILPARSEARRELRQRFWYTITSKTVGMRLKIMALWAIVWPWSYCVAHKLYARIRGTDTKYEVK
mgnify:CR=1 FL=1